MSPGPAKPEALQAMLRKAEEKLAVSQRDLEMNFFDDAASRAYYAVYHAVSAVLAERGLSFSTHGQTLGAFNREFVKTNIFPADTFRKIQRLYGDREVGDYDWKQSVDQESAERDLEDAKNIVKACRNYLEKLAERSRKRGSPK